MFSDLPHCPRQQIVMRNTDEALPPYINKTVKGAIKSTDILKLSKSVDISGVDRHRFFYRFVNFVKCCTEGLP